MGKRKGAPDDSEDKPNSKIVEMLLELGEFEKGSGNLIKYNAYRKAAASVSTYHKTINSGADAKHLPGVGVKIVKKIDELLNTGALQKLEKIRGDDNYKAVSQLLRVSGIGPTHARKLISLGIRTIEDLRKNQQHLNNHQKIGLKYVSEFEQRIPRAEIEEIEKLVVSELKKLDERYRADVCGSYRRGKTSSGDVDFLITHPEYTAGHESPELLTKIVATLETANLITDSMAHGKSKFMGVCRLPSHNGPTDPHRRIDIRILPHDQYYCALLYFTGSDLFNKRMRLQALEKGFTLNEYSIRPLGSTGHPGEPLPVTCEKDIFDYVGMEVVPPTARES